MDYGRHEHRAMPHVFLFSFFFTMTCCNRPAQAEVRAAVTGGLVIVGGVAVFALAG